MNEKPTAAVVASGLTKRYGATLALDGVDLAIPSGQILALLGPNGAGKSTTTELILGLARPDAGQIRVFGQAPRDAVRRGDVSAMLQNGALLETSVSDLLKMMRGLHAHPLPLDDVIERARLATLLRKQTTRLSGGEAQRVRFGLAIMADPRLLILDEPTVGLDPDARQHFWATMAELAASDRTILFATHYLAEADEFADRIVVLNGGRVIADGTGPEIKAHVSGRVVSFTGPDRDYVMLPGVRSATRRGVRHELTCTDSDATLRVLLHDPGVTSVEVASPSLEDAFLHLVS